MAGVLWRVGALLLATAVLVLAPPPNRGSGGQAPPPPEPAGGNDHQQPPNPQEQQKPLYEFAYSKYLEEVVRILEEDPKFNEKLRGMPEEDIKAGKIADHVDELPDPVVERLHKSKLAELERLRESIAKQVEAEGGAHNVKMPEHLDLQNWEKFNKEDLRLLIKKTVADMDEIDKHRREEFKDYEMKKKAEEDHKFAQLPPEERAKAEHNVEEAKKRHNEHEKLKHPGSRDQLAEVWEDSDKMEKDQYDPRTFFALHDLNGDNMWNQEELEALFQIELEKMYNETNPDDDQRERMEEMYRMREHVVQQMDKNGDRMISLDEFLQDSEAQTPNKDSGWDDLGQQQVYTDEELKRFEMEYAKQQGWGADAYEYHAESTPAPPVTPPLGQPIQPAEVHRGGAPDPAQGQAHQQQQQQHNQPPPPPQHVQQQQQANQPPPPPNQQQQHQVPPAGQHVPIQDAAKDPAYGI